MIGGGLHMGDLLLDVLSCCRLVNAPKLFRTVLKLARTCAKGVTIMSSP